jgi:hypothetical protein
MSGFFLVIGLTDREFTYIWTQYPGTQHWKYQTHACATSGHSISSRCKDFIAPSRVCPQYDSDAAASLQ